MILALLLACDDTIFGVLPDTGGVAIEDPDYTTDVEPIWLSSCDGCHTGGVASGGLTLDGGAGLLVGVPSTEAPALSLVEPGDVSTSYLYLKLTDQQETGSAMPLGSELDTADLGTIENWITLGAVYQ